MSVLFGSSFSTLSPSFAGGYVREKKVMLRTGVLVKSASRFSSQVMGTAIVVLLQA